MSYVSSYGLPGTTEIFISSASLDVLDQLSTHASKRLTVKHIKINLSHYDITFVINKGHYAAQCYHWHVLSCDYNEHFSSTMVRPTARSEFDALSNPNFDGSNATSVQKEILASHREYVKKFEDQEAVRKDGSYVTRLASALARIPGIESITIDDEHRYTPSGGLSMDRVSWKSEPYDGGAITSPPVELIADVFQALEKVEVRPTEFKLKLGAPRDLRSLRLDTEKQSAIRRVLERSKKSAFEMGEWNRGVGADNLRSTEEMRALGTMTKTIFSTPYLESVALWMSDFRIKENLSPTLAYLLPWTDEDQWHPGLRELKIHWVSFTPTDMQVLLDKFQDTLVDLDLWYCHVAEGKWEEVFDILHGFTHLEKVRCNAGMGGEIGFDPWRGPKPFPGEEAKKYLLRKDGVSNPLRASVPK